MAGFVVVISLVLSLFILSIPEAIVYMTRACLASPYEMAKDARYRLPCVQNLSDPKPKHLRLHIEQDMVRFR